MVTGDCLDVMRDMGDASVDIVVTDPPYGIRYKSGFQRIGRGGDGRTIARDADFFTNIPGDEELTFQWLEPTHRVLRDECAIYCFTHWRTWCGLMSAMQGVGFTVKNMLVMRKSNHGMGDLRGAWAPKHELCLFATKGRHLLRHPEGRRPDVIDVPILFSGARRYHPAQKPTRWFDDIILASSDERGIVLDPFAGSGSIGVSALQAGRKYTGIEKDSEMADIARTRLRSMRCM